MKNNVIQAEIVLHTAMTKETVDIQFSH